MNDVIAEIAKKAGLDEQVTENGMGALLATLKKYSPSDNFTSVTSEVPGANEILNKFQSLPEKAANDSSGILGMASSLFGGKAEQLTTLYSMFSRGGFSMDMIKQFLPAVLDYFQANGSSKLVDSLEQFIPGISKQAGSSGVGNLAGKIGGLFS